MTKKHFVALADALYASRLVRVSVDVSNPDHARMMMAVQSQWERDVQAIADACGKMNSRFDRERWMDYVRGLCGPNGGGVR